MAVYKKIFIDGIMHLGDMIMSASVLPVLKKTYPDSDITYLAMGNLAHVAELLEGVDHVIPYTYKSKGGYMDVYRWGKKLGKERFDLGISLDPRERVTLMKWFAHIPVRVSLEQALGWKLGWEKWFYTHDMAFDQWDFRQHRMSESYQALIRQFLQDQETTFYPSQFKASTKEDVQFVNGLLENTPLQQKKIAFCVETTEGAKDWPAEQFSVLADQLAQKYNAIIIMTGIPRHNPKVQQIISGMRYQDAVVNIVGKTSFTQLIALFRKLHMVVTLDTGTSHIAAAAGCPVVTIFSHNSPEIYQAAGAYTRAVSAHLPCSGKYICIGSKKCEKTDCVDAVTVDMVMKEVESLLG